MVSNFVVPSVLGNAIGGVLLVALLNYGQVAPERKDGKDGNAGKGGKEGENGKSLGRGEPEKEPKNKEVGAW